MRKTIDPNHTYSSFSVSFHVENNGSLKSIKMNAIKRMNRFHWTSSHLSTVKTKIIIIGIQFIFLKFYFQFIYLFFVGFLFISFLIILTNWSRSWVYPSIKWIKCLQDIFNYTLWVLFCFYYNNFTTFTNLFWHNCYRWKPFTSKMGFISRKLIYFEQLKL